MNPHLSPSTFRPDAAELHRWSQANKMARAAYQETKADHALPYGCDNCTVGSATSLPPRGDIYPGLDLRFCCRCKGLDSARHKVAKARALRGDR